MKLVDYIQIIRITRFLYCYVTKNRGLKNISLYMSVTSQHIIEKRTTHWTNYIYSHDLNTLDISVTYKEIDSYKMSRDDR